MAQARATEEEQYVYIKYLPSFAFARKNVDLKAFEVKVNALDFKEVNAWYNRNSESIICNEFAVSLVKACEIPDSKDTTTLETKTTEVKAPGEQAPETKIPEEVKTAEAKPASNSPSYYAIHSLLSIGGQGCLYAALDLRTRKWVVIKTIARISEDQLMSSNTHIHPDVFDNPATNKFWNNLTKAKHEVSFFNQGRKRNKKNTATCHYSKTENDVHRAFMVFSFEQGQDLQSLIDSSILPVKELLEIAINKTLDILNVVNNGILHRDIAPKNVMVNPLTKRVRVIDFGIANRLPKGEKTIKDTNSCGTPGYAAPESENGNYGESSDVYSLGKSLALHFGFIHNEKNLEVEKIQYRSWHFLWNQQLQKEYKRLAKIFLNNYELYDGLYFLITSMISPDPANRPSLDTVLKELSKILNLSIGLSGHFQKIAFVDLEEYENLKDEEKELFRNALGNNRFNEIYFVDVKRKYENLYVERIKQFKKEGLHIGEWVYGGKKDELKSQESKSPEEEQKELVDFLERLPIPDQAHDQAQHHPNHPLPRIRSHFFVTKNETSLKLKVPNMGIVNYHPVHIDNDISKFLNEKKLRKDQVLAVLTLIKDEIFRLMFCKLYKPTCIEERIIALQNTYENINKNVNITYAKLEESLTTLQGKMTKTWFKDRGISKGAQKIKDLREKIRESFSTHAPSLRTR